MSAVAVTVNHTEGELCSGQIQPWELLCQLEFPDWMKLIVSMIQTMMLLQMYVLRDIG